MNTHMSSLTPRPGSQPLTVGPLPLGGAGVFSWPTLPPSLSTPAGWDNPRNGAYGVARGSCLTEDPAGDKAGLDLA